MSARDCQHGILTCCTKVARVGRLVRVSREEGGGGGGFQKQMGRQLHLKPVKSQKQKHKKNPGKSRNTNKQKQSQVRQPALRRCMNL